MGTVAMGRGKMLTMRPGKKRTDKSIAGRL